MPKFESREVTWERRMSWLLNAFLLIIHFITSWSCVCAAGISRFWASVWIMLTCEHSRTNTCMKNAHREAQSCTSMDLTLRKQKNRRLLFEIKCEQEVSCHVQFVFAGHHMNFCTTRLRTIYKHPSGKIVKSNKHRNQRQMTSGVCAWSSGWTRKSETLLF